MNDKITAAKVDAILDPNLCFFGTLICNLKFVEDKTCKTAWTDGTRLGYNPDYINSLPHSEVVGLLAHETLHCAGGHPWRRDNREHKKFNYACDYAINQILTDAGIALPKGSLVCPPEFVGKSAEWIYDRLPDMPEDENGDGEGIPGEVRDGQSGDGSSESDQPMTEGEWQEISKQAAAIAKARGTLPASLDRFSKSVAQAKVDWKSLLRRFVQQSAKSDYSWAHPSSRYISMGFYLPGLHSESTPRIAIGVDTSGSMDNTALQQAQAEVEAVMQEAMPSAVDVLYADARVAGHDTFEQGETLEWRPKGGGGTDFRPVFDAVDNMEEKPACIIYITDLCGTFPDSCDIPTLWITDTDGTAPFGETIKIG